MIKRLQNQKGQALVELVLLIPLFILVVFGSYDLALMHTGLFDTMNAARNTVRRMAIVDAKKEDTKKIVKEGASTINQIASYTGGPVTLWGVRNMTPQNVSGGRQGNYDKKITELNGGDAMVNVSAGSGWANAPVIAQSCAYVQTILPSLWEGTKKVTVTSRNGQRREADGLKVCASYFLYRQFQLD